MYYDLTTSKWYTAQDYSATTSVTVRPKHVGDFTVRVKVKDQTGTIVTKDMTLNSYGILTNTSPISATTATLGGTVIVYGSSTGGLGNVEYEYTYYNSKTKTWQTAKDYSTDTTASIRIAFTGKYTVRVRCRDTRGVKVAKDFTVTVT